MGHEGNEANSPQMTEDAVREVIRERLDENVCVVSQSSELPSGFNVL